MRSHPDYRLCFLLPLGAVLGGRLSTGHECHVVTSRDNVTVTPEQIRNINSSVVDNSEDSACSTAQGQQEGQQGDLSLCSIDTAGPLVEIAGPSREAVFDCAARLVRSACKDQPPCAIMAVLETPHHPAPGGRDSWCIIVGADVAFSPTGLDPYFLKEPAAAAGSDKDDDC